MRLHSRLRFAPAEVLVEKRPDGVILLRSPQVLATCSRTLGDWLVHWSERAPDRVFLAERHDADWCRLTYRDALTRVRRIAQALLDLGLDQERPVAILSENSIDHALLALGAMHVGVPVAPISPAYSLMSKDYAKLKYIFELLQPGLVFANDPLKFGPALAAVGAAVTPVDRLLEARPGPMVDAAFSKLSPDSTAKILFTSGSTGIPKGVINTHRMLCANQQMLAQVWPFLHDRVQTIVDWLPWNHTFGGNFCFNLMLSLGGTLYVDGGKPAPGLVDITVANLSEVSPTLYFNVPRGFDLLLPHLEQNAALRRTFFRNLDLVFYAGAGLPQNLWERLERIAIAEKGGALSMVSSWGSTETAPSAATVHYRIDRAGVIGLPNPGCELKLVPSAGKLEVRVRGPHVTPGYYRRDDLTREAFDEEGFYRIGDAMRFADPSVPERGLVFDGRVAEDFKLTTGTWVSVGAIRTRVIAALDPLVQDAVIAGHDRDEVGVLLFLNPATTKALAPAELRDRIAGGLASLSNEGGSSTRPARALILLEPPSIDGNEITDKGYINQRAVLERRAALVTRLYSDDPDVITTR
jgi:feruloyl-CoA synthase